MILRVLENIIDYAVKNFQKSSQTGKYYDLQRKHIPKP